MLPKPRLWIHLSGNRSDIFILRVGSATIAGTEFKLTAREVDKIEEEAEALTEESECDQLRLS